MCRSVTRERRDHCQHRKLGELQDTEAREGQYCFPTLRSLIATPALTGPMGRQISATRFSSVENGAMGLCLMPGGELPLGGGRKDGR
jgi:hypothetical protein